MANNQAKRRNRRRCADGYAIVGVRLTLAERERVEEAGRRCHRCISAEIRHRLDMSFETEKQS